jgi:hypothetical protein
VVQATPPWKKKAGNVGAKIIFYNSIVVWSTKFLLLKGGSTLTEERSQGEVVDTFKFAIINHPGLKK